MTFETRLCIIRIHSCRRSAYGFYFINLKAYIPAKVPEVIKKKEGDSIIQTFVLLFVLGAGSYFDIREHRIPNWWILAGMVSGILLTFLEFGEAVGVLLFLRVFLTFLGRMAAVTALFFILFLCRMVGAGDIKLAALICGCQGLSKGAVSVGLGFLIGALWSLVKMRKDRSFLRRISYFLAYFKHTIHTGRITAYYVPDRDGTDNVIPLGPCLLLGTVLSLCMGW